MNLITYINVIRSRRLLSQSDSKASRLNKRTCRNLRLLRQFSLFTIFYVIGWTPFTIIEVFDRQERWPDLVYLYALTLPPICVLIDSSVICNWNKLVHQQVQAWWQSVSQQTTTSRQPQHSCAHDRALHSVGRTVDV